MEIRKRSYTAKAFVYVLLWSLLLTAYSHQACAGEASGQTVRIIPDEEMPIILDLIASRIRDNYMRVVTWSGKIDVKVNMLHTGATAQEVFKFTDGIGEAPESILQKVEEKITFVIDANKNFLYVDNFREKPSKYFNHNTGDDLGNIGSHPYWSTIAAKPDFSLEAMPASIDKKENRISRRRAVKKRSSQDSATGLYQGIGDPREIFVPGGIFTWDHFDTLMKKIERYGNVEFDGYKLKMEEHQKGDAIEYRIVEPFVVSLERSSPDHYIIVTKTFSSQCGFNMIHWEATSGSGMLLQRFTWEYESINGAYLPKKVIRKHYCPSGDVVLEKDWTYFDTKVNRKVPPETFEYVNLKLKEGDLFVDEFLDKKYRYKAATQTLEPIDK